MNTSRILAVALVLFLVAPFALAEEKAGEARRIALPDEGLALTVPGGWTMDQYGPAALKLTRTGVSLWFYPADEEEEDIGRHLRRVADQAARDEEGATPAKPTRWKVAGATEAMQLWTTESKRARFHGVINRAGGGFHVEADLPANDKTARRHIEYVLTTVNVQRWADPKLFVDYTLGFTLRPGIDWAPKKEKDGRIRFLRTVDGKPAALVIEQQGATIASASDAARLSGIVDASKRRLTERGFQVAVTPEKSTTAGKTEDGKVIRASRDVVLTINGAQRIRLRAVLDDRFALVFSSMANDDKVFAEAAALAATFKSGTFPGAPVKDAAKPTGARFPRKDAPPVTFTLPAGWKLEPPASRMRAAQFSWPEGTTQGIVYYFGAGGGGGLEANIARWKGQWTDITSETRTDPKKMGGGDGVGITLLEIAGRYTAPVRPGAPERNDRAAHRLLAAFVTCPQGPLFFKVVAPAEEVERITPAFKAWLRSMTPAK